MANSTSRLAAGEDLFDLFDHPVEVEDEQPRQLDIHQWARAQQIKATIADCHRRRNHGLTGGGH
ncbi:hypothetical protein [Streptomyces sp. CS014]|uniref:hypothetical protein n=1 Tax=Streptomyces sp. CS014 TaxID=2162707 RepID=UPI000D51DFF8|nr:hypothetical protein [Streptomyces sp. CS014]PVD04432.1 hypothetical protein DBP12_03135 [Streptomyces sp. CS014]